MSKVKLKEMVLDILATDEKSRNCDQYLTLQIWCKYYPQYITRDDQDYQVVKLINIYIDLPREDHIKRIRAIIQNVKNKYLPTDEKVRKQRKITEEKWIDFVRNEKSML